LISQEIGISDDLEGPLNFRELPHPVRRMGIAARINTL
jgi:hypothetical protein